MKMDNSHESFPEMVAEKLHTAIRTAILYQGYKGSYKTLYELYEKGEISLANWTNFKRQSFAFNFLNQL